MVSSSRSTTRLPKDNGSILALILILLGHIEPEPRSPVRRPLRTHRAGHGDRTAWAPPETLKPNPASTQLHDLVDLAVFLPGDEFPMFVG